MSPNEPSLRAYKRKRAETHYKKSLFGGRLIMEEFCRRGRSENYDDFGQQR